MVSRHPAAATPLLAGSLASIFLLTGAAPPPEAQRTFTERSDVTLVEVPATVVGRDGEPLRDLTAADFELFDDGAPQKIEAFETVDLGVRAAPDAEPWRIPAAGRRHLLLLFDLSHCTSASLGRAREAAARYVRETMAREDLAAVATVSIENGFRLLVPFTTDRSRIAGAVESVELPSVLGAPQDPLPFTAPAPGDNAIEANQGTPASPTGPDLARPSFVMHQKSADDYAGDQVGRQLSALGGMADSLDAVSGRKTVVFFSEGFDGRLLLGAGSGEPEEMRTNGEAMIRGQLWNVNTERRYGNSRLQDVFGEAMSLFRRSNSAIYPIDIAGLRVHEKDSTDASRYGRESLEVMAQATGGQAIRGENDVNEALRSVRDRTSRTSILYFRPTRTAGEGTYHKLKVRVKRRGARVSARAGYYERRAFSAWTPLQRALSAADAIAHERPADELPIRLLALCLPSSDPASVPVIAEIPGERLLAGKGGEMLRLGVYLHAVSETGEVRDSRTRLVSLDLEREALRLRSGPLRYYAPLRLPPGRYRIRALVRDESNGLSGFQAISLDVPNPAAADPLLLAPPLFVAAEGGVSLRDGPASGGEAASAEPLDLGGSIFAPRSDPALTNRTPARVCLFLRSAPGDTEPPALDIAGRVREEGNEEVTPTPLRVVGRTSSDATGLWKVVLEFTPGPLAPGRYLLGVTVHDQRTRRSATAEAPFQIS